MPNTIHARVMQPLQLYGRQKLCKTKGYTWSTQQLKKTDQIQIQVDTVRGAETEK